MLLSADSNSESEVVVVTTTPKRVVRRTVTVVAAEEPQQPPPLTEQQERLLEELEKNRMENWSKNNARLEKCKDRLKNLLPEPFTTLLTEIARVWTGKPLRGEKPVNILRFERELETQLPKAYLVYKTWKECRGLIASPDDILRYNAYASHHDVKNAADDDELYSIERRKLAAYAARETEDGRAMFVVAYSDKDGAPQNVKPTANQVLITTAGGVPLYGKCEIDAIRDLTQMLISKEVIALSTAVSSGGGYEEAVFVRTANSNLWQQNTKVLTTILTQFRQSILYETEVPSFSGKVSEYKYETLNHTVEAEKLAKSINNAIHGFQKPDVSILDKITDKTEGKVFYRDGYYDLTGKRFVSTKDDPIASTFVRIERYFLGFGGVGEHFAAYSEEHPIIADIRKRLLVVFGDSAAEQNNFLRNFSRAMGGVITDKIWYIITGERNSGKGCIMEAADAAFGDYVTTCSPPLVKTAGADPAQGQREVITANLYKARIAFSSETKISKEANSKFAEEDMIDGMMMKARASGGDPIICRTMQKNELRFRCTAKMFLCMNKVPQVAGSPDCLQTLAVIPTPFMFAKKGELVEGCGLLNTKESNDTIKKWVHTPEVSNAFTWMVFNAWKNTPVNYAAEAPPSVLATREVLVPQAQSIVSDTFIFCKLFKRTEGAATPVCLVNDLFSKIEADPRIDINALLKEAGGKAVKEDALVTLVRARSAPTAMEKRISHFLTDKNNFKVATRRLPGAGRTGKVFKCYINLELLKAPEKPKPIEGEEVAEDDKEEAGGAADGDGIDFAATPQ